MIATDYIHGKKRSEVIDTPKISTYNFAETSGNTLVDSTGGINGYTVGTLVNCLGKKHRSQIFLNNPQTTKGSYAIIPHHGNFNISEKFTVEGFLKFHSVSELNQTNQGAVLIEKRNDASSNGDWAITYYEGKLRGFAFGDDGTSFITETTIALEIDKNYHFALVIDKNWPDCVKLYVDGVLLISEIPIGNPINNFNNTTATVAINTIGWSSNYGFHGFSQYEGWTIRKNVALTQAEIQAKIDDYNIAPAPIAQPLTTDLLFHWNFNELAAPTVESINGFSATPTGSHTYGVQGVFDKALSFSGGKLTYPHNSAFNYFDGVTNFDFMASCYVKFNSFKDGWIFNKRDGTSTGLEYQLSIYSNQLRFQIWHSGGAQQQISIDTATLTTGSWIKISVFTIRKFGVIALAINNKIVKNTFSTEWTGNWATGSKDFAIGCATWDNIFWLDGAIDNLKFWRGIDVPKGFFFHE
ncbi:hypothetical protein [Salinimicrobium sp. WS361]|uniref:hypothetical protein n=1 Tax=Salinimicrobium sp. WS361 TaxID=3425123 RepID=UPI003D7019DC